MVSFILGLSAVVGLAFSLGLILSIGLALLGRVPAVGRAIGVVPGPIHARAVLLAFGALQVLMMAVAALVRVYGA